MRNYKHKLGAAQFCPLTYNASRMSYREAESGYGNIDGFVQNVKDLESLQ